MENDQRRRLALVTGASSGIGAEFARAIAERGEDLVMIARRRDRLEAVRDELLSKNAISVHLLPLDLTLPGAVNRVIEFLEERNLTVDRLVNNAGYGLVGRFHEIDREKQLNMIQLNVTALTDLTRQLLPGMVKRGTGSVINVASSAAFEPSPLMGLYHATKAYVLFMTEALAEELRGTGVTATALCPGPTAKTEFGNQLGSERKVPGINLVKVKARDVARAALSGADRGKVIVVPGLIMKISSMVTPRLPRWFVRKATHRIQKSRV